METQTKQTVKKKTTQAGEKKHGERLSPSTNTRDFIKPLIKEVGKNHPLEDLFDKDQMPVLIASGLANLTPNKGRGWISYKITFQGDKILAMEVSEPGSIEDARMGAVVDFQLNLENILG